MRPRAPCRVFAAKMRLCGVVVGLTGGDGRCGKGGMAAIRFTVLGITAASAALAAGMALSSPAQAQDGEGMRAILGMIGVLEPPRNEIDYRERGPLVLPQNQALRTPQTSAQQRANWPKDPDVEARKAAQRSALMPATQREAYIMGQRPLLSQEELRRGRILQADPSVPPPRSFMDQTPYETQIEPILIGREIAARRAALSKDNAPLGPEPPRRFLSDPPVGLRKPAGTGEYTQTPIAPRQIESKFGQREFIEEQARR